MNYFNSTFKIKKSSARLKAKKGINKVSKKLAKELVIYRKLRLASLEAAPICQRCGSSRSEDIHHMRGRGKYLNDVFYFLVVCRECHQWIHNNPVESKIFGYTISRLGK